MSRLRNIKMNTSPLVITTTKDNYILSKNAITSYPIDANTDRSTNLFINSYRIVGGCVALNQAKDKVLMIRSTFGGNFIIPKGGIEFDELLYRKVNTDEEKEILEKKQFLKSFLDQKQLKVKKSENNKIYFNYENIPGATYDFSEGSLREAWEEAGIKGAVNKVLGTYYDYRDPKSYADFVPWTKRKPSCFPKAIDSYYQVIVEEVCDEWPEKSKRVQKWLNLDECVDNLLNNGRLAALRAVMKSDLVKDLQKFYITRYERDIKNFNNPAYKKAAYFRNKSYSMRSPTTNLAKETLVHIILNKEKNKFLIDKRDPCYLLSDCVSLDSYPFVWRSSRFFKKLQLPMVDEPRLIKLNAYLDELPCGYDYSKEFDEIIYSFDKGTYKSNLTALEFSCFEDEKLLQYLNEDSSNQYQWISLDDWKNMIKDKGELFRKLEYFLVEKSGLLATQKPPAEEEEQKQQPAEDNIVEKLSKLNI